MPIRALFYPIGPAFTLVLSAVRFKRAACPLRGCVLRAKSAPSRSASRPSGRPLTHFDSRAPLAQKLDHPRKTTDPTAARRHSQRPAADGNPIATTAPASGVVATRVGPQAAKGQNAIDASCTVSRHVGSDWLLTSELAVGNGRRSGMFGDLWGPGCPW